MLSLVLLVNHVVLPRLGRFPGSYLVVCWNYFLAVLNVLVMSLAYSVSAVFDHCGAISESGGGCKGHVRNIWIGTFR